jgi:hypothetical protein
VESREEHLRHRRLAVPFVRVARSLRNQLPRPEKAKFLVGGSREFSATLTRVEYGWWNALRRRLDNASAFQFRFLTPARHMLDLLR